MMPIELVIFDIAGTLIEDHDEVTFAFHSALQEQGIVVPFADLREFKGGAKREVIRHFVERERRAVTAAAVDAAFAAFRRILEDGFDPRAIAGVEESLRTLAARKVKIATITGFYRELRDAILQRLAWTALFDANVSSDDVTRGRPAPDLILRAMKECGIADPGAVMVVGDTPLDLQCGTAAGVRAVVGVLTGVHPPARLEREPHTHLIASAADVPELVASLV